MKNTRGILTFPPIAALPLKRRLWRMKKCTPRGLSSQSLSGQIRRKHRTEPKPRLGSTTGGQKNVSKPQTGIEPPTFSSRLR